MHRGRVLSLGLMAAILYAGPLAPASATAATMQFTLSSNGQVSASQGVAECIGPGTQIEVTATLANDEESALDTTAMVTFDSQLIILQDSCEATSGACTLSDTKASWSGMIAAHSTEEFTFLVRVPSGLPAGQTVCAELVAQFGTLPPVTDEGCFTTTSGLPCGVGAPALGAWSLGILAVLLPGVAWVLLRRRVRLPVAS